MLVSAYARSGSGLLPDAHRVFDDAPGRDLHLYSALLTAVSHSSSPALVLPLLRCMLSDDALSPDHFVLASLASAAARLRSLRLGRQLHAHFEASPFRGDDVVKSSLIDMYCKCGVPEDARKVFDSIGVKNNVVLFTWTALISGFVKAGNNAGTVELFVDMRRDGVNIDDTFVLATVIGGVADLAALVLGRQLHGFAMRLGFLSSMIVRNALVDMYSKCSDIHSAEEVFEGLASLDIISWTTILIGEAQHGRAEEVLALYDRMVLAAVKPNELDNELQEGSRRGDASNAEGIYGIKPGLQHYTCCLDLLSHSGYLSKAEELITRMPYKPDEAMWGALLSACKKHNDVQMCMRVADNLLELRPKDPSTYILLSNVYAVNCKWDSVAKVRKLMAEMEIRKEPGYSWIEAGKEVRLFHAGEVPLDLREEITGFLEELASEIRKRGYVPDTSSVMHDLDKHEKEQHLFLHSERLAVAFGILKSPPRSVIRIVKNLRVCGDCHTVMKFISEIAQRKIIVRDASRFHHFEGGNCSCSEFW
ncbi:hypothetical protein U9M48_044002 [Paspalum notatum var. saurae]|uniref:DYW domain-containing protein n=1 Tax=Paspalum notatum var. saurae TaxID=547442 RepID=A0AAQ3XHR4_PASNO